ncbi:Dihydrofolate synthase @ Folylpolyglutamate synthase [hydrothermal vent metagenome]|uniref:tetrahydrofolate synthase n=1 Tax=hydrothermal vent metagenome TaxID=652676 RepID=A0A3B1C6M8_9ZZZZ
MTYAEAVSFLNSLAFRGIKLGLENIESLLSRLGDPHRKYKTIHVAGTNGKGSVATLISSILTEAGIKNGLYTSPHLETFHERAQVNGKMMNEQEAMMSINNAKWAMEQKPEVNATYFEFMTALAFLHFARAEIKLAVIEVGLGGRFDSTNVVIPEVSVITSIALDHMEHLGGSLKKIAMEKCGIIKEGRGVIACVRHEDVVETIIEEAGAKQAPLKMIERDFENERLSAGGMKERFNFKCDGYELNDVEVRLVGRNQIDNASLAIMTALALRQRGFDIGDESIRAGLMNVALPGRFEAVAGNPVVILDGAHNPKATHALNADLVERFGKGEIDFVFGAMKDKNYKEMIKNLAPSAKSFTFFSPDVPRAPHPEELANAQSDKTIPTRSITNLDDVIDFIGKAPKESVICVTGSFFTVGEIRGRLIGGGVEWE